MASPSFSKELVVLRKNFNALVKVVEQSPVTIGANLWSKGFISATQHTRITSRHRDDSEKATIIVNNIITKTESSCQNFYIFLQILTEEGSFTKDIVSKLAKEASREFVQDIQRECPTFTLLVIGVSGAGKSTLINNLLGEEVAVVGDDTRSQTKYVESFTSVIQGVPVEVYDTPGLEDSDEDCSNEAYLEEIKLVVPKVHAVIYCFDLRQTRMMKSLSRAFRQYTEIGVDWSKAVFALTFADELSQPSKLKKAPKSEQVKHFIERIEKWKEEISQAVGRKNIRQAIHPTTGDLDEELMTGEKWFHSFWLTIVQVLPPAAMMRFLEMFKDSDPSPAAKKPKLTRTKLHFPANPDKKRFVISDLTDDEQHKLSETTWSKIKKHPSFPGGVVGSVTGIVLSFFGVPIPVAVYAGVAVFSVITDSRKRARV